VTSTFDNFALQLSSRVKPRGQGGFLQIPTSKAMVSFIWRRQRPLNSSASRLIYFPLLRRSETTMAVTMTAPFLICASITTVSALISLGFSIAAVVTSTGVTRVAALYVCPRSLALAIASAIPFFTGSGSWLLAIALCMTIVQAGDAAIGVIKNNRIETFGPLGTAALNLIAIIWLA